MITQTTSIPEFYSYADYYGFSPEECLFFDIETTGLSSASACIFLIGTISYNGTEWILTQWMTQSPQEEVLLLQTFLNATTAKKMLLHFNGSSFDIPFIKERSRKWELHESSEHLSAFETMQSVDLYQKLKPLKKLYDFDRFTQQALEQFTGWNRTDKLTGKHMTDLYKKYLLSEESRLADLLLLHNHDDLLGMLRLLPLTDVLKMINSSFISDSRKISIMSEDQNQMITFRFSLVSPLPASVSLKGEIAGCEYILTLSASTGTFTIHSLSGELRYFFSDYKNYYYLPAEDQAIHKSIGNFVAAEFRQNANPCNCYTRKCSIFLPQPRKLIQPSFQKEYGDKISYFELTKDFENEKEIQKNYAMHLLSVLAK